MVLVTDKESVFPKRKLKDLVCLFLYYQEKTEDKLEEITKWQLVSSRHLVRGKN